MTHLRTKCDPFMNHEDLCSGKVIFEKRGNNRYFQLYIYWFVMALYSTALGRLMVFCTTLYFSRTNSNRFVAQGATCRTLQRKQTGIRASRNTGSMSQSIHLEMLREKMGTYPYLSTQENFMNSDSLGLSLFRRPSANFHGIDLSAENSPTPSPKNKDTLESLEIIGQFHPTLHHEGSF